MDLTTLTSWLGPYGVYLQAGASILGGLVFIASVITPLTKTPKDDEFLAKAKALLHRFSIFEPKAQ